MEKKKPILLIVGFVILKKIPLNIKMLIIWKNIDNKIEQYLLHQNHKAQGLNSQVPNCPCVDSQSSKANPLSIIIWAKI